MATAKKLPSGSYRSFVYIGKNSDGKRQYKSFTADTKKDAEYAAALYLKNKKTENSAENLTFQKASDQYIADKSNILSPATIRGYRIMQRNAFNLLLKQKLLSLETDNLIQQQMNANAIKYSAKSIANQYGFITTVLRYFKCSIPTVTLKPTENTSIPVPTQKDAEKIMDLLAQNSAIECQVLLALTCSLRQSEIAGILIEDVDGDKIHIHAAKIPNEDNKLVYKETNKSEAGTRTVTMPPTLTVKIKARCDEIKTGPLFTMSPSWLLKRFKRMLECAKMPPYTIHSLRHCFAATMHALNVPDKYVMEMGGWKTDSVLKNIYQYTFEDETVKAKRQANEYFEKAMHHEMHHDGSKT